MRMLNSGEVFPWQGNKCAKVKYRLSRRKKVHCHKKGWTHHSSLSGPAYRGFGCIDLSHFGEIVIGAFIGYRNLPTCFHRFVDDPRCPNEMSRRMAEGEQKGLADLCCGRPLFSLPFHFLVRVLGIHFCDEFRCSHSLAANLCFCGHLFLLSWAIECENDSRWDPCHYWKPHYQLGRFPSKRNRTLGRWHGHSGVDHGHCLFSVWAKRPQTIVIIDVHLSCLWHRKHCLVFVWFCA